MVQNGRILNEVFHGSPGVGKTSAARILLRELGVDVYELNGSFKSGGKTIVKGIDSFAHTVSVRGKPKVCFIDEADQMSVANRNPLRCTIDNTSGSTRFLMTANDTGMLTKAIKSRSIPISFESTPTKTAILVDELTERLNTKLQRLGLKLGAGRIREIVDFRSPI